MLIPLGFWAASAGGGAAGSFDLLETQVLSSSAASVTFSGLSAYAADYQHLQIRVALSSGPARYGLRFNGASSVGNYAFHYLFGSGSSVLSGGSSGGTTFTSAITCGIGTTLASSSVIDILDPFETTKNTTIRSLSGVSTQLALWSGVWLNTNSTTSIEILGTENPTLNFAVGSRFSLYGIKAGA